MILYLRKKLTAMTLKTYGNPKKFMKWSIFVVLISDESKKTWPITNLRPECERWGSEWIKT